MEILRQAILEKGRVLPGNVLKVGAFLNNQLDVKLLSSMADEIYNHFNNKGITKILTVEASGIALAVLVAERFGVNAVFAKKSKTANVDGELLTAECYSYTHKVMNNLILGKEFLLPGENVLVVDDFLANGQAVYALKTLVEKAGANFSGVAIAIEKGFQGAGDKIRGEGIDLYSLAIIDSMSDSQIVFR
ncbi:MAG: xanthine phosphoribosyltransferase [Clostridia bacterium]|nr:xanthine phosphoribosyltransferase [Clostridia bacterium]